MKSRTLLVLLGLCIHALSYAQQANPFKGSWTLSFQAEKRQLEAQLTVAENGSGTWRTTASRRGDNCIGREAPISLNMTSSTEAALRVKLSEVLQGCSDLTAQFKIIDEKRISGKGPKFEFTGIRNQ